MVQLNLNTRSPKGKFIHTPCCGATDRNRKFNARHEGKTLAFVTRPGSPDPIHARATGTNESRTAGSSSGTLLRFGNSIGMLLHFGTTYPIWSIAPYTGRAQSDLPLAVVSVLRSQGNILGVRSVGAKFLRKVHSSHLPQRPCRIRQTVETENDRNGRVDSSVMTTMPQSVLIPPSQISGLRNYRSLVKRIIRK
jgi:hypothetical protein